MVAQQPERARAGRRRRPLQRGEQLEHRLRVVTAVEEVARLHQRRARRRDPRAVGIGDVGEHQALDARPTSPWMSGMEKTDIDYADKLESVEAHEARARRSTTPRRQYCVQRALARVDSFSASCLFRSSLLAQEAHASPTPAPALALARGGRRRGPPAAAVDVHERQPAVDERCDRGRARIDAAEIASATAADGVPTSAPTTPTSSSSAPPVPSTRSRSASAAAPRRSARARGDGAVVARPRRRRVRRPGVGVFLSDDLNACPSRDD